MALEPICPQLWGKKAEAAVAQTATGQVALAFLASAMMAEHQRKHLLAVAVVDLVPWVAPQRRDQLLVQVAMELPTQ